MNDVHDRGDGWIADTFNTTVKMSSYLNCLAIGEFEFLESTGQYGMPVCARNSINVQRDK
jgi:aminopeptidase N